MWQAIRRRAAHWRAATAADGARPRDASLRLKLPNPYGGPAWISATVALSSRPRGAGEALRMRGHIDSCFRLPATADDRAALAHGPAGAAHSVLDYCSQAVGSLARSAIERLPQGARDRLSGQRRRGWLDVQFSTAPLDAGAAALMPEPLRKVYGDRLPQAGPGGPRIGVWAGPAGGPRGGLARLAMVQIDPDDRGAHGRRKAGEAGFSLNLSVAELLEPAGPDDDSL